jgi:hypothetical protein
MFKIILFVCSELDLQKTCFYHIFVDLIIVSKYITLCHIY